MNEMNFGEP